MAVTLLRTQDTFVSDGFTVGQNALRVLAVTTR